MTLPSTKWPTRIVAEIVCIRRESLQHRVPGEDVRIKSWSISICDRVGKVSGAENPKATLSDIHILKFLHIRGIIDHIGVWIWRKKIWVYCENSVGTWVIEINNKSEFDACVHTKRCKAAHLNCISCLWCGVIGKKCNYSRGWANSYGVRVNNR